MKKKFKILICLFLLFNLVMVAYGMYKASVTVHVTGKVKTYELAVDSATKDLGEIELDQPKNFTVEVSNVGNQPLYALNMSTANVVGLSSFVLIWNKEGISLSPGESVIAKFSLTVHAFSNPVFGFDLVIKGE